MKNNFNIEKIPVWLGAQTSPSLMVEPFSLEIDDLGLIRMSEHNVANKMIDAYSSSEYHFITSPPGASDWGNTLAQYSIDGLKKLYGDLNGVNIVEIGGGTLYSAEYMIEKMGAKSVTIVDPSVKENSNLENLRVVRKYFDNNIKIDRPIQLITSFNTLEHVPDPVSFLSAAWNKLEDDGMIYLKLPGYENSLLSGDLGLCVHEHLTYFTSKSLEILMGYVGFEKVSEDNYPGALQILARKVQPNKSLYCEESKQLLVNFENKYQYHIEQLRKFASDHKGESIAFIGASVGLSNILYLSRINKIVKIGIFDSDILKSGKYLPGIDVAICHIDDDSLDLYKNIFIAPINFFSEIELSLKLNSNLKNKKIYPIFPAL
jgi:hypothetical protein